MLQNDQAASLPSDSPCPTHTEFFLMATATALVGYLVVYLAFFDSTGLL